MDPHNPYAAPGVEISAPRLPSAPGVLASRLRRLGAATLDSLFLLVFILPARFASGSFDEFPAVVAESYVTSLLWGLGGAALWVGLNSWTILQSAQSLGKRVVGIKIVDLDGNNASFTKIVAWRFLPITLADTVIPGSGGLVGSIDILFIFRSDRRCLHDFIAGTQVVHA